MNNLNQIIEDGLTENGASIVGFADLSEIPAESRSGMRFAVSFGVALDPDVIKNIGTGPTAEYYEEYNKKNELLDRLGVITANILKSRGYNAVSFTKDGLAFDEESLSTTLPFKIAARMAGLGWIGKCALLVTERFGSALRLSCILTNAPLDVNEPVGESKCGDCNECKIYCPGNAVTGLNWRPGMERSAFYDAYECSKTARRLAGQAGIDERICGKCILVCPWTKKYLRDGEAPLVMPSN